MAADTSVSNRILPSKGRPDVGAFLFLDCGGETQSPGRWCAAGVSDRAKPSSINNRKR
jgi:hypothetical protein